MIYSSTCLKICPSRACTAANDWISCVQCIVTFCLCRVYTCTFYMASTYKLVMASTCGLHCCSVDIFVSVVVAHVLCIDQRGEGTMFWVNGNGWYTLRCVCVCTVSACVCMCTVSMCVFVCIRKRVQPSDFSLHWQLGLSSIAYPISTLSGFSCGYIKAPLGWFPDLWAYLRMCFSSWTHYAAAFHSYICSPVYFHLSWLRWTLALSQTELEYS